MNDLTDIYDGIFAFYKEFEKLTGALKNSELSPTERAKAESRLAEVQKEIDALTEKIPENT